MNKQRYHIQYGTTTIEYDLAYAPRKTLAISVDSELHVSVIAPPNTNRLFGNRGTGHKM